MGLKAAFGIVDRLLKLGDDAANVNVLEEVAKLRRELLAADQENIDLIQEKQDLKRSLNDLKSKYMDLLNSSKNDVYWESNLLYQKAPNGEKRGQFCPNCYECNGVKHILNDQRNTYFEMMGKFSCSRCKTTF